MATCLLNPDQHYSEWKEESCFLQTDKKSNSLLWGDSFLAHYIPGIKNNLNLISSNLLQYTSSACAPAYNYDPKIRKQCKSFNAQIDNVISKYDIRVVVMSAAWSLALDNGYTYETLKHTINLLRARGIKVFVIGQGPYFDRDVQDIFNNSSYIYGKFLSESLVSLDLHAINTELRKIAGADNFVNPSEFFCVKQVCRFKSNEGFYFYDKGHLTAYGSTQVSKYIFSKIKM